MQVFVLDKQKHPLMPCNNTRARQLLKQGRAVVHRVTPFTIRLKHPIQSDEWIAPIATAHIITA
jgi:hypothetical protein